MLCQGENCPSITPMKRIATIQFSDRESGDEAVAIVRSTGETTGLALSLRKNGDIEVFFGNKELKQLIEALQKALGEFSCS
jgi:hypothetical protein